MLAQANHPSKAMSKTGSPNNGLQNEPALPGTRHRYRMNSLEALERGVALFRSTFSTEAWRYYVGTAPLVLSFIPMWVINGQIKVSDGVLLFESVLVVSAYLLRVCVVTRYMQRVRERAFGTPAPKRASATEIAAIIGRLVLRKLVLSVCALAALPTLAGASWFYSAGQFASIEKREEGGTSGSIGSSLTLSGQWFSGGLLFLFLLMPLWAAVWLNGLIVAIAIPQLLHSVFGLNTILSTQMGLYALVRSSAFWLSSFAATWLALDPIVKCSYVIVYQHLRSLREGYDLRDALASLPRHRKPVASPGARVASGKALTAVLIVLFTLLIGARPAAALPTAQDSDAQPIAQTANDPAQATRVQTLRHAIDEESRRPIYRWHDAAHPSPPNWLDKMIAKIGRALDRAFARIARMLKKLWPGGLNPSGGDSKPSKWTLKDLWTWLIVVAVVTIALGAILIWLRRRRDAAAISIPPSVAPLPDLSDAVLATTRSEDEWFVLASQLEGSGDFRSALRAVYLGLLAGLAQREWLTIRRDRTNRDYLDEFTRRWRRRPQASADARTEIPGKLRSSMRQFDRVWYGFQMPTADAVATYRRDQKELLSHV
jgi:hypothetical protein